MWGQACQAPPKGCDPSFLPPGGTLAVPVPETEGRELEEDGQQLRNQTSISISIPDPVRRFKAVPTKTSLWTHYVPISYFTKYLTPKAKRAVSVLAAPLMCPSCHPWVQTEMSLQLRACSEGREHRECWGHFPVQKIPTGHLADFPGSARHSSPCPQHQLALWTPTGAIPPKSAVTPTAAIPPKSAVKSSCKSQLPADFCHSRQHPRDEILLIFQPHSKKGSDQKRVAGSPVEGMPPLLPRVSLGAPVSLRSGF